LKEVDLSLPSSSSSSHMCLSFSFIFIFFCVSLCFKWSLWIHVCIDKHNKIQQPIFFSSWKVCVLIFFYFFNLFFFLFLQTLKLRCMPIAHLQEKTFYTTMSAMYVDFDHVHVLIRLVILEYEIVDRLFTWNLLNVGAWQVCEYL
jgi:hypothetical protein